MSSTIIETAPPPPALETTDHSSSEPEQRNSFNHEDRPLPPLPTPLSQQNIISATATNSNSFDEVALGISMVPTISISQDSDITSATHVTQLTVRSHGTVEGKQRLSAVLEASESSATMNSAASHNSQHSSNNNNNDNSSSNQPLNNSDAPPLPSDPSVDPSSSSTAQTPQAENVETVEDVRAWAKEASFRLKSFTFKIPGDKGSPWKQKHGIVATPPSSSTSTTTTAPAPKPTPAITTTPTPVTTTTTTIKTTKSVDTIEKTASSSPVKNSSEESMNSSNSATTTHEESAPTPPPTATVEAPVIPSETSSLKAIRPKEESEGGGGEDADDDEYEKDADGNLRKKLRFPKGSSTSGIGIAGMERPKSINLREVQIASPTQQQVNDSNLYNIPLRPTQPVSKPPPIPSSAATVGPYVQLRHVPSRDTVSTLSQSQDDDEDYSIQSEPIKRRKPTDKTITPYEKLKEINKKKDYGDFIEAELETYLSDQEFHKIFGKSRVSRQSLLSYPL